VPCGLSVLMVAARPARVPAMPSGRRPRPAGALGVSPPSGASAGCSNVMKATHSRSKSPGRGDVGSPHRSHGWRNEKRGSAPMAHREEERGTRRRPPGTSRAQLGLRDRGRGRNLEELGGTPQTHEVAKGTARTRSARQPRRNNRISPRKSRSRAAAVASRRRVP
jgi:hypothetical protein